MSQDDEVLEYLKSGRTITPDSAHRLCGTLALHSLIARLRKKGNLIPCTMRRNGRSIFGEYRLI